MLTLIKESIRMSWHNIAHNKMRSFLTTLGITIGITAIIALITIVSSVTTSLMSEFSSLGTNTLSISAQGSSLKQGLSDEEFISIGTIEGVEGVAPSVNMKTDLVVNGEKIENISIEGKNETYFQRNADSISEGRGLNLLDVRDKNTVCLVNESFVDAYFPHTDPLGQTIIIKGIRYEVVGVMEDSSSVIATSGSSVLLPYKNVLAMNGSATITSFEAYMAEGSNSSQVIANIEAALDGFFNYKDNTYKVTNMQSMLDMMNTMQTTLSMMLAGIASIALLVGGIGIMNMMLVSVTERTTEIGLRKALGARPSDIQLQFVVEALILSLIGGVIGIILGLGISFAAAALLDTAFTISWLAIGLGVGFSFVVGLLFGWAPARKASRLNPIDALRSN